MKIKLLVLQDTSGVPLPFTDSFESSEYDVYRATGADVDKLTTIVNHLQPDLILCEDHFFKSMFHIEEKLPKNIPFIFFTVTGQVAPQVQVNDRPIAYLTSPFEFNVLNAVVKLMVGPEILR
ncbi:hypothetical protein [Runella sp.]|uniref:hypothetical protein n=1 Tax=Runella sp. TaxID=1960881 RepID=UPI003D10F5C3